MTYFQVLKWLLFNAQPNSYIPGVKRVTLGRGLWKSPWLIHNKDLFVSWLFSETPDWKI